MEADPNISRYEATLKDLMSRSEKGDREQFFKLYDELKKFAYESDYSSLYSDLKEYANNSAFKASVNRAAEYIEIYGSFLYPQNPTTTVVPAGQVDDDTLKRFELEAKVLDYTMRRGDMEVHVRRMLNEALLSGRGIVWYGYNPRKKTTQVSFDTVRNLGVDPDAKNPEEINWIWRKRQKPRFEFKQLFTDETGESTALIDVDIDLKGSGDAKDLIEYTVWYFKVGMHNYCRGMQPNTESEDGKPAYDDAPKKVTVAEGRIVAIEEWDVPMDLIGAWPCEVLDFRLQPEQSWPRPTMEPGLTHLRAMNWLYTFYINRVRNTAGNVYARIRYKGGQIGQQQAEDAVNSGYSMDGKVIDIEVPSSVSDPDVNKMLQRLTLDSSMQEFDRSWALTNRAFEDATGLNDLVRSGQDTRQIRTASDVDFKAKRSLSRVDDMRKQFQGFLDRLTAGWAFLNRFLLQPEDIAKWFGQEAGQRWGRLGTPQDKQMEEMARMEQANAIMQQSLMQAQEAQAMGVMPPPPPDQAAIEAQLGPRQVIVMEDWINEARREIVASSMRVIDQDAQVDNASLYMQTMAPLVAATPPGQKMNAAMIVEFLKVNRYSAEAQAAATEYEAAMTAISNMQTQMMLNPPPPVNPQTPPGTPPGQATPPNATPEPDQGAAAASRGLAQ